MKPGAGGGHPEQGAPYRALCFLAFPKPAVGTQPALFIQGDPVAGKQLPLAGFRRGGREQQKALAVFLFFRYESAGKPGGPLVLVVQPGQHPLLPCLLHAGADFFHKGVGQVRHGHAAAGVHVKAAHAHLLHIADFPAKQILVQVAVPGPEGRAAVFRTGIPEKLRVQGAFFASWIQHGQAPFIFRPLSGLSPVGEAQGDDLEGTEGQGDCVFRYGQLLPRLLRQGA